MLENKTFDITFRNIIKYMDELVPIHEKIRPRVYHLEYTRSDAHQRHI